MGRLKSLHDEREVLLAPRCILGRGPHATLRVSGRSASREHAILDWSRGRWCLRDLGSSNGTRLNGAPLDAGAHELVAGDLIELGGEDERWVLVDARRPPPAAFDESGAMRLGEGTHLLLPDDVAPTISVYAEEAFWVADDGEKLWRLSSGDSLHLPGGTFELLLPDDAPGLTTRESADGRCLGDATLTFEVDADREAIAIFVDVDGERMELPDRRCHRALLALAWTRHRDERVHGRAPDDAGWMKSSELARRLDVRPEKLNLDVFNARKLFANLGLGDAGRIVERRPGERELRIGVSALRFIGHD